MHYLREKGYEDPLLFFGAKWGPWAKILGNTALEFFKLWLETRAAEFSFWVML